MLVNGDYFYFWIKNFTHYHWFNMASSLNQRDGVVVLTIYGPEEILERSIDIYRANFVEYQDEGLERSFFTHFRKFLNVVGSLEDWPSMDHVVVLYRPKFAISLARLCILFRDDAGRSNVKKTETNQYIDFVRFITSTSTFHTSLEIIETRADCNLRIGKLYTGAEFLFEGCIFGSATSGILNYYRLPCDKTRVKTEVKTEVNY